MNRYSTQLAMALLATSIVLVSGCQPRTPPATGQQPPVTKAMAPDPQRTLTVFAGSGTKPGLDALARLYEERAGVKVEITYGGSGAVLNQFAQEQFGDVYVPGSDDFMDKAEKKDAILKQTRTILVYLVPVINVPKGNPQGIQEVSDLTREGLRVVVGEPETVCIGEITKGVLEEEGLWEKLRPRLANYGNSCEAVLQSLLTGEADVVIGWDVFARQHPDQIESIPLKAKSARVRHIPGAVIKWSRQPEAAGEFIGFLASEEAKRVWEEHGYTVQAPPVTP